MWGTPMVMMWAWGVISTDLAAMSLFLLQIACAGRTGNRNTVRVGCFGNAGDGNNIHHELNMMPSKDAKTFISDAIGTRAWIDAYRVWTILPHELFAALSLLSPGMVEYDLSIRRQWRALCLVEGGDDPYYWFGVENDWLCACGCVDACGFMIVGLAKNPTCSNGAHVF